MSLKKIIFLIVLIVPIASYAGHIAGGEMYYAYLGPGSSANTHKYQITLRLFRQCNPPLSNGQRLADLPGSVQIGIFNMSNTTLVSSTIVTRTSFNVVALQAPITCVVNVKPGDICYQVATYSFSTDLPINASGYTAAYQTCCRSNSLVNIQKFPVTNNSTGEGATYACEIPGTDVVGTTPNSSAVFSIKDTVLVCQNKNIKLEFTASDPDGDSLSYALCAAYNRGAATGADNVQPSSPPYQGVTYLEGFSGEQPLGPNISIDPVTGIIQGRAPANGGYVVNVCVTEWRNNKAISVHRKDFMVTVANCDYAAAELPLAYVNCTDSSLNFENQSASSAIHSYSWDFGVTNITTDTSSLPTPSYTYPDTGTFTVKLVINKNEECTDSAEAIVKVYPGFTPDFVVKGSCLQNPYRFFDSTKAKYGVVDSWRWDFGDDASTADTSRLQNPSYQYGTAAVRPVTLIVTSSKGCIDTITKQVDVRDKPLVDLAFRDTLICSIDTLPLHVNGTGVFTWTPTTNMLNPNSADPLVFPKDTTVYKVTLNDNGCINTDSVKVNVLDSITVSLADTTICRTDSFRLQPVSYGLQYNWSPATGLSDVTIKNPMARPLSDITYQVVAHLGKCQASTSARIKVVPYPLARVFPDTSICYGSTITLRGSIVGSSFIWSPPNSLAYANTLTPVAGPQQTTAYVLAAYDTLGCPKPGYDTALIKVIPPVQAFAGNDTIVVTGQPLQLNATGGSYYYWTPPIDLNNRSVANPIAVFDASLDSITYVVRAFTPEGCYGDDSIKIKIFRPNPEVYVPSGFTPNSDGRNDVLRPIAPGIKQLKYFRVFNRWGQLLFSTSETGKGWDGTYEGKPQPSGTYVYMLEAIDYLGKVIVRKGTSVLIR